MLKSDPTNAAFNMLTVVRPAAQMFEVEVSVQVQDAFREYCLAFCLALRPADIVHGFRSQAPRPVEPVPLGALLSARFPCHLLLLVLPPLRVPARCGRPCLRVFEPLYSSSNSMSSQQRPELRSGWGLVSAWLLATP